ncbi:DUF2442 domain-containing protein [Thermus tengchongensis]|uniref:DUF2442 domain-containing protein n=1 Tax=Thermus tengchongensis TaxID=1214928 RepID=A0ABY2K3Z9_9DEIN|nr:DUF2442 domain-containing protein [Thermus tengchongensis]TFU14818.1 DUF2442 domain-containing protein [Thermus tengchongensis]
MWPEVVEVRPLEGLRLWLRFSDGSEGIADLSGMPFPGILEGLKDPSVFAQARVDPELGTVVWPGGIDLDPLVLHALATGSPLPVAVGGPAVHLG